MTKSYVYKLKKPVLHSFLDFSTLDARYLDCLEEVRLNRRLAAEVYLGVIPLTIDEHTNLHLNGSGITIEWLVKMRRLPGAHMLDQLIRQKQVTKAEIEKLTHKLARFYKNEKPQTISQYQYRQQFLSEIRANQDELSHHDYKLPGDQLQQIYNAQLDLVINCPDLFNQRVQEKRIIEAHGDLRPEHICLINDPVIIDCLEFNRKFRILDPVHELAYLSMECEFAGADFIGPVVFDIYCHQTGDFPPTKLINFYKGYRATVRAKLAVWHIKDHEPAEHAKWIKQAKAYLRLADKYITQFTQPP